jgi:uncharacterized protein
MIRFTIIIIGIFMIIKKLYEIIKFKIEAYRDTSNKHFFNVQVAKSAKEVETGLMWITKMPLDQGMLFEYKDKSYPSMWMKNTMIPLDAIFINSDARVVHIEPDMKPGSKEKRKTKKMCKYVLEINGGLAKKIGIKEGDLIGTTLLNKNITNFKAPSKSNFNKKKNNSTKTNNSKKKNNSLKNNNSKKKNNSTKNNNSKKKNNSKKN